MKIEEATKQFKEWEGSGWSKSETPNSMALVMAISALEKQVNGELIERVYCKDCKHSQPEDKNRGYCTIKGRLSNKQSFCEAMERK